MRTWHGKLWIATSVFFLKQCCQAKYVGGFPASEGEDQGKHQSESGGHLGRDIRFAHYNILAKYLGKNTEPWFLIPLNISQTFRQEIQRKFYSKDANGVCSWGFHDGFGGLLSQPELDAVSEYNRVFEWSHRGPHLVDVVRGLDADILSLVEMDVFQYFSEALADKYVGAFAKRPRAASYDGSSIFWKRDRFSLVDEPINTTFQDWEPSSDCDEYHEDRVMLAVALNDTMQGKIIVAASVHLARNPEDKGKDPMRMLEASQMMKALSCYVAKVQAVGLVIMGDFNAMPNSFTHTFLLHGWQDCPESEKAMKGVFDKVKWESTDVACTTKTLARAMWIDYIFYSSMTMELSNYPEVEPCPSGPIPNEQHPSDHLPLKATLHFRPGAEPLAGSCRSADAVCQTSFVEEMSSQSP